MGNTTMAAGKTSPNTPINFTAVMFAAIRVVTNRATTTTKASEYPSLRPTAPCLDKSDLPEHTCRSKTGAPAPDVRRQSKTPLVERFNPGASTLYRGLRHGQSRLAGPTRF